MRKLVLTLVVTVIATTAFAQQGFIRGKVLDGSTGESLFGATVVKQGTIMGTSSDFDGNFSLTLPVGTHNIVIQSVSFRPLTLENVEVKEGEATILDVVMEEDVQQLGEVVVTATVVQDSEAGVMLVKKKSLNAVDGISASTFRKVGDSDLSSAMKRVTGVAVQGDKYVYVRGLGDRYTKTSINGMVIPGLDPDRNDVQIDIFPTGILENVLVYKTFTPDLTGSFTGGLVDIQTKAFPDEKSTSLSLSMGYNPDMHFNNNYLKYDGASTDWLGFDNGKRDLPVQANVGLPKDAQVTNLFNPTLGAIKAASLMNSSFSFSHRNQIVGEKLTWGLNALLTYRNNYSHFKDFERKRYERDKTGEEVELVRDYTAKGDLSSNEVLWSGLISIAAKSKNMTVGTNFLNIQSGVSTAVDRTKKYSSLNNGVFLYNDILAYTERNMFNNITYGKHQFGKLRFNWTNSLILSKQDEPDYRETAINKEDEGQGDGLVFRNGGQIIRFWRSLSEVNESFRLDLDYELNKKNKLKGGGGLTTRHRDFGVYSYSYMNLSDDNVTSTDPNDLLTVHVINEDNPNGLYIKNDTDSSNAYVGKQVVYAGYLMNEMSLTERLKTIYGVRMENVLMLYSGQVRKKEEGTEEMVKDLKTLNQTNFLPSLSLIYAINENMNLRGSFNKTLARPSFKEKSEAFITDPITDITFIGNIGLKQAEILNYDLRWEYFFKPGELFSASLFYKDFTNHIALVAFDVEPNQVKPRNVGSAVAYGAELEMQKQLSFLGRRFNNFSVGGNLTYTVSKVDRKTVVVNDNGENEYQSEVNFNKTEDGVKRFRNMSMQAPYSINGSLNYDHPKSNISANLSYNVQGETLTIVSAAQVPEVYTRPFHSLNFKVSKDLGKKLNSNVSLRIQNILGDNNEQVYKSGSQYELFMLKNPGTTFTLSYRYSF